MFKKYKATYYDGKTPDEKKVNLDIFNHNLRLEFDDGTFKIWKISEVLIQNHLPINILRIEFGKFPPETLIISDSEFIKIFYKTFSNNNRYLLFGIALTIVFLITILIYWGIPSISSSLSRLVPIEIEEKIGKFVLEELFPNRKTCNQEDGEKAANKLIKNLSFQGSKYQFNLEIVDSDLLNAIAFPGGKILIFRGLLDKSPSAEALAGVISHEMQHILQQHGTKNFFNQIALSGIFKLLTLGDNDMVSTLFRGIKILSILKYSREFETEADELALKMLIQKKIDPEEMISLFIILKENTKSLPGIISTHPDINTRIENLKRLLGTKKNYLKEPVLSINNWNNLKSICKKD